MINLEPSSNKLRHDIPYPVEPLIMTLEQSEHELNSRQKCPLPLGKWRPWIEAAVHCWDQQSSKNWIFFGPRFRVAATLRGASIERLLEPEQGAKPYKIAPAGHHPAHRCLHAVGLATATESPVLVVIGQAALANGSFHEALNLLSLRPAPVCFLLFEEQLRAEAPVGQQSGFNPALLCDNYQLTYHQIDAKKPPQEALAFLTQEQGTPALVHLSL